MQISFVINGQKITPMRESSSIDEILAAALQDKIEELIGSVRCHEHGTPPEVIGKGENINHITFQISGCCEKFIAEVEAKLAILC